MKNIKYLLLLSLIAILLSCQNEEKFDVLTERIQYDVPVKNANVDDNWWVNNIVGPDREELVKGILEKAKNGEIQAYDYFNELLTPDDVRKIGIDTTYKTVKRSTPPYDEYDTMMISKLEWGDITKLRFLEEWKIDKNTFEIKKEVIGIAPVKMVELGGMFYTMPLFWIYLDKNYPARLKE